MQILTCFDFFVEKAQTDGDCLNPKKAGSSDHILIPCGTTDGNKVRKQVFNTKTNFLKKYMSSHFGGF